MEKPRFALFGQEMKVGDTFYKKDLGQWVLCTVTAVEDSVVYQTQGEKTHELHGLALRVFADMRVLAWDEDQIRAYDLEKKVQLLCHKEKVDAQKMRLCLFVLTGNTSDLTAEDKQKLIELGQKLT